MAEPKYFHHCLLGLAYTEKVFRRCCMTQIGNLHRRASNELKEILKCIVVTEKYKVKEKGWISTALEHICYRKPACNEFICILLQKLPCVSNLNRTEVLKALCQNNLFEFASLFSEPWMRKCVKFEEMDAYCLFLVLDNVSYFNQYSSPSREALYQEHIGKMRKLADSCLHGDVGNMTKADRDVCLQAMVNALALVNDPDADEAIRHIREMRNTTTTDILMTRKSIARRYYFMWIITEFQQEVIEFVSDKFDKTHDDEVGKKRDGIKVDPIDAISSYGHEPTNYDQLVKDIVDGGPYTMLEDRFRLRTYLRSNYFTAIEKIIDGGPYDGIEDLIKNQPKILVRPHVPNHYKLVKEVVDSEFNSGLEELFSRQISESLPASQYDGKDLTQKECIYFQATAYYLENANVANEAVRSLLNAVISPGVTSDEKKKEHVATLEKALERQGPTISLQEIVCHESKSTNFKVCHLAMITMEKGLRQYCKDKLLIIYKDVKRRFPNRSLCDLVGEADQDRLKYSSSAEIKFKHECKNECNSFLQVVLSKRSAKCSMTPQTMFGNVNPRDCVDTFWGFAKLFLEPCMRKFHGFDELDSFCLLTLLANVKMIDGNQSETNTFLRKVCKARNVALKVLESTKQELTKQMMEGFLEDIVVVLETCTFHGSDRIMRRIRNISSGTSSYFFDIRFDIESKRQQRVETMYKKSIIRDENKSNWFRMAVALKCLQPSLVPIIEKTMNDLHKKSSMLFGQPLCSEAKCEDITRGGSKHEARFKHSCSGIGRLECNSLLDIIRNLTPKSTDLCRMLRGTDPHTWLSSSFDFTRIFLKDWVRLKVKKIEDCDVGALCHIILHFQPLRKMFNVKQDKKNVMKPVKDVRSRLMHCSSMEIGQQEMEGDIDVILDMLRHIQNEQVGKEVTEAIEDIEQIKTGDFNLPHHEAKELLEEVRTDLNRKLSQHKALMHILNQNINQIETELGITYSNTSGKNVEVNAEHKHGKRLESNADGNFRFWCRCALALKYLQHAWMPFVRKEMDALHLEALKRYRGKLCVQANSKDMSRAENDGLKSKQSCPNDRTGFLDFIQTLFTNKKAESDQDPDSDSDADSDSDSDDKLSTLQDTDPTTLLSSSLAFTTIFIKSWMRLGIQQFEDFDISALCAVTYCCQSLREKTDETLVSQVRSVRNTIMHCATLQLGREEMEENIDVILKFILHLKMDIGIDLAEADESIQRLRNTGFTFLHGKDVQLLQAFASDMRREITCKTMVMENVSEKLTEIEKTFGNILSEGTLSGQPDKDADTDECKPSTSSKDWRFDEITVGDPEEIQQRRENQRQLFKFKKNIRQLVREKRIELDALKKNIDTSIKEREANLEKEREAIDISIKHSREIYAEKYDNWKKFLDAKYEFKHRADKLYEQNRIGLAGSAFLTLGTILSGGTLGVAAGLANAGGAFLAVSAATAMVVSMGVVSEIVKDLDFSTEEGCREGVRRMENELNRCDIEMNAMRHKRDYMTTNLKTIDRKVQQVIPDLKRWLNNF